jgi:hypothetical protein
MPGGWGKRKRKRKGGMGKVAVLRPGGLICMMPVNSVLWPDISCYKLGRQPERYGAA